MVYLSFLDSTSKNIVNTTVNKVLGAREMFKKTKTLTVESSSSLLGYLAASNRASRDQLARAIEGGAFSKYLRFW